MPEKALGPGYVGMASVVGVGSCDSVASITSNHSALSDESYDYLSAEERDVLMYLEETIDSLDAEGDSGLSTEDSEPDRDVPVPPMSPKKASPENPYENKDSSTESPRQKMVKKNENGSLGFSCWNPDVTTKPGYNSLPKNLMIPRVELTRDSPVQAVTPAVQATPPSVHTSPPPSVHLVQPPPSVHTTPPSAAKTSLTPEKPKRWSLAAASEHVPSVSEIGLIPPPEPFRDMHPIMKHASLKKDALPMRDNARKSDFVDGTDLKGKSGVALEKHQSLVASPRNTVPPKDPRDLTCAPLQHDPTIPASATDLEPAKEEVNLRPVLLQQSKQLNHVSSVISEPKKEMEVLRSPRWLPIQEHHVVPGNAEFAKESQDPKLSFQQDTQLTPSSKSHKPEISQPPKGQVVTQIRPLSMTEQVGSETDQKKVPLTSQAQQEHSALQENLQQPMGKTFDTQFKQGPPTHPKPLKLPSHIIVKPGYTNYNIDPEQRSRTQSLINFPAPNRNRSSSVKTHIIKDQQTPRQEALEKLKLSQVKANPVSDSIVTSVAIAKVEHVPTPQIGMEKVANDKITSEKIGLQDKTNTGLQDKPNLTINHAKSISGVRSRQFPLPQENASSLNVNTVNPAVLSRTNEIPVPQSSKNNPPNYEKVGDGFTGSKSGLKDKINTFSVSPEKVYGGLRSREFPPRQTVTESGSECPPNNGKVRENQSSPKLGLQDQKNKPVTNPGITSGGLRSEFPPSQIMTENESLSVKSKVLSSSQHDLRPGFRFAHGPAPGLREINFKSNTLERSGIGMSTDKDDEQNRNSSSDSIFQKPTSRLTPSFLKKNRPRPASMGTAVDFKAIQEAAVVPTSDSQVAKPESRRSSPFTLFSSKPRPTSLISVKITPKNSADEHREALKKLGLLHE